MPDPPAISHDSADRDSRRAKQKSAERSQKQKSNNRNKPVKLARPSEFSMTEGIVDRSMKRRRHDSVEGMRPQKRRRTDESAEGLNACWEGLLDNQNRIASLEQQHAQLKKELLKCQIFASTGQDATRKKFRRKNNLQARNSQEQVQDIEKKLLRHVTTWKAFELGWKEDTGVRLQKAETDLG